MAKVKLSVSISDSHLGKLAKVAAAAKKAGMTVDQQLGEIGILTGAIESDKIEKLRRIEGVSAVEPEREISIAPPESKVQ